LDKQLQKEIEALQKTLESELQAENTTFAAEQKVLSWWVVDRKKYGATKQTK
tara:strand:- start:38 stop:193 length:156 start_codon:yes stop_codon:yes gene_type:complete